MHPPIRYARSGDPGIEFEDRGAHLFKGIDEARRVYRVAGV